MQTNPTPRPRRSDRYRPADAPETVTPAAPAPEPVPFDPTFGGMAQPVTRPTAAQYQQPRQPRPAQPGPQPARPTPRPIPDAQALSDAADYAAQAYRPYDRPAPHRPAPGDVASRIQLPPDAADGVPAFLRGRPAQETQPRAARPEPAPFPAALSAALVVLLLLCGALLTGKIMMNNYLTDRREAREAAYQRVVTAHPLQYRELIEFYAGEYNLQPAFVASIILNESSYSTSAESGVGARGLMQLMPDTAAWIAHKLGLDATYSAEQLWEAETNIRFGCWYLNYLSKLFGGDPVTVASAYHAGQGEITGWLSNAAYSPDGRALSLSAMPEGPTKTYAGRVIRDYAIYDALYFQVFNRAAAGGVSAADVLTAR